MHIQDIELRTGLDRATIRYYEKEGIVVPARQENGYRTYSDADEQLLLKVKLLRQLGVSLQKIKSLQQGSIHLDRILEEQICALEGQILQNAKARNVCKAIKTAGADYQDLDAAFYLQMLHTTCDSISHEYREPVKQESHPVRRFIARTLDTTLLHAFILFILVVLLRVRPWGDLLGVLVQFISHLLWIPIEAAFLHFWGTTPGKWVMGIRLESAHGGKLNYDTAVYRALSVTFMGCGLYLPFIELWRLIKSYQMLQKEEELSWDEDTEVIYTDWSAGRKATGLTMALVCACLLISSSFDSVLPKNRDSLLTTEEFTENFNFYKSVFDIQDMYTLEEDGSWSDTTDSTGMIIISTDSEHIRAPFQYKYSNDKITSIYYCDTWSDVTFIETMPHYCLCAVYAMLGSRPGITCNELIEAGETFAEIFDSQFEPQAIKNSYSGNYQFKDVLIEWNIELDNIEFIHDGLLYETEQETGTYMLELTIAVSD